MSDSPLFKPRQYALLLLCAVIWGSGFVGQKLGMEHVSPFAFTFFRTLIGGLCLLPVIALTRASRARRPHRPAGPRALLRGALACGACLIAGETFQQYGLIYTEVSKASFLTSMYLIFVPLFGLLCGHRLTVPLAAALGLAVSGIYLLSVKSAFLPSPGDLLVLLGAACFAAHILVIDRFTACLDGLSLSCGQFFAASALGFILMLSDGVPSWEQIRLALPAFAYVGVMSNGVAYTLQIIGQRGVHPTVATLILALEAAAGAVFGALLLGERLAPRELAGAALMCAAVLTAQLPARERKKQRRPRCSKVK